MFKASIDIGSNSILLLIADIEENYFGDEKSSLRITSLGKGLDKNGFFSATSINDSVRAIQDYKRIIDVYKIPSENIIVVATEASRVSKNSEELLSQIEKILNLKATVLTGAGEAYYTAYGVMKGDPALQKYNELCMMDVGGASTELIKVDIFNNKVLKSLSLPLGCVRGQEWLEEETFYQKLDSILGQYDITPFKTASLISIAGTMTSLAAMYRGERSYSDKKVEGTVMSLDEYSNFFKDIKKIEPKELLKQYPFLGKRSFVIQAGGLIAKCLGEYLGISNFRVSTYGLRHGVLFAGQIQAKYKFSLH